jgi:glycosyltransferase involved in cell wall biosynthesis
VTERRSGAVAIDYLSPLPPVRSGISEYSADLLPELFALAGDRLRVIALAGQPIAEELVERWHPATMEHTGEGGRLALYHMGNNLHHLPVWETASRIPGILVLHDLVLHHFLIERTLARGELDAYVAELEREHGWAGRAAAVTRKWNAYSDAAHFAFPANGGLLRRQKGVLVHSRWAASRIAEQHPGVRVRAIPMGIPVPPPLDRSVGRAFRERHGIPHTVPLLGSFGFQTPIKRTDAVIRALADPRLASVRLVVVGEEAKILDLGRTADEAGVSDRVTRLGYAPFDELEAAMAATDLSVNLRYPSAGETSASLLRLLAVGRPVLVSDYAQFSELPDHVAVKAPLDFDHEVEALAGALAELLSGPERLRQMGEDARRFVQDHHQPARAARVLLGACSEWAELEPPDLPPLSAPSPTTRTWGVVDGDLRLEGLDHWQPGRRRRLTLVAHNRGLARWLAADRGSGGVMFEVRLELEGTDGATVDLLAGRPWAGLPADLAPGLSVELELELRRPSRPAVLSIEPHVVGVGSFRSLGGPVLRVELGAESATFPPWPNAT